jgi:magnesium-transporting ATPase (P-type)
MTFSGFESLCNKLKVDPKVGLSGHDFAERTEKFGNNYREEPVAKSWFSLFIGALDDQMLKLLIVCAIFSITFDMILADPHERAHGKD